MTAEPGSAVQDSADGLRAAMVDELRRMEMIISEPVAAAVAAVPRHLFAPGESLETAYSTETAVVVKRGPDGRAMSALSASHIQAAMLEQAEIAPGMRVLEVGTGGYNAALVQELVGDEGHVVSIDIDPDIVARARTCLDAAGYGRVCVEAADAELGWPEGAPYHRIIVTAGAWDLPPAWLDQLTDDGRIVVPLRIKGLVRSIAFDRDGTDLVSRSYRLCGFVPMQGSGSHAERLVWLDDEVALRLDDETASLDFKALGAAAYLPGETHWSGASFDLPDELELFVVTKAPRVAMLHVNERLVEQGIYSPAAVRGVAALIDGGSFAYRTKRPDDELGGWESGVIARGPDAEAVATQHIDLLRRWASNHRRRNTASIRYTPNATSPGEPSPGVIVKRHGTVTVSWP